ncbi:MAG: hypothetical protein NVS2B3_03850 [Vulcanimicrobiaceae bacterium]
MDSQLRQVLSGVRIVPAAYVAYQPLIVDGLVYFLEHLPAERLNEILAEQFALGSELDSDERILALLRRCPTLHKLGQVIGHDAGLPADLRARLQALESLPPAVDFAEIEAVIRAELGETAGIALASEALAEGSVAVVVRFAWTAAPAGMPREGVFKIVKPRVAAWLLEELAIWPDLAAYLTERSVIYGLPPLDYADTLDGVRRLLLGEIRLDLEQERLARAGRFYADFPAVVVPRVLPMSTARMTAMEYVPGRKITESGGSAIERKRLAAIAIEALLGKPFWSTSADAHFHADPHAGNVYVTSDGRVALLDWALTTELSRVQREGVVRALLGAATLDAQLVRGALVALGAVVDDDALAATVATGMRALRFGAFPGFDWLTGMLDGLAREADMTFTEETTVFRKLLLTLQGVATDVSSDVTIDSVLVRTGLATFARELGRRASAPVTSRDFGTHVSTLDLLATWASLPWVPTRFWLDAWRDLLVSTTTPARAQ